MRMKNVDTIAAVLIEFLQSADATEGPICVDTDLLASGKLDSLLVMDLVCFLEARFQIRMQPTDINPDNLRSVRRLANYLRSRSSAAMDAA
jgi:acyl carrier protein